MKLASTFVVALLVAATLSAGCMTSRVYMLPVSAREAKQTFEPIAKAARTLGYRASQHEDFVTVEPDSVTRIDYVINGNGAPEMCVMIKDKEIDGSVETAFRAGKRTGDEVWSFASELRRATRGKRTAAPLAPKYED